MVGIGGVKTTIGGIRANDDSTADTSIEMTGRPPSAGMNQRTDDKPINPLSTGGTAGGRPESMAGMRGGMVGFSAGTSGAGIAASIGGIAASNSGQRGGQSSIGGLMTAGLPNAADAGTAGGTRIPNGGGVSGGAGTDMVSEHDAAGVLLQDGSDGGPQEDGLPGQGQMNPMANPLNLGACGNGRCARGGEGQADVEAPADEHDWATNTGQSCIPVAKINADLKLGKTLSAGRTPDDAVAELESCLQAEDCFRVSMPPMRGDGFGPPVMVRDDLDKWRQCFEVLCACNNQVIDGPEVQCRFEFVGANEPRAPMGGQAGPAGGQGAAMGGQVAPPRRATAAACNAPGAIAIFNIPPDVAGQQSASHAMTVDSYQLNDEGQHQMELFDPNCPAAGTATVLVDDKGNVLESLSAGVPDTGSLIGCFTFQ